MIHNEDDKVWCTVTRTINLGNYESVKVEAGMSKTVHPNDTPMDVLDSISDEVFSIVRIKSREFKKALKSKPKREVED